MEIEEMNKDASVGVEAMKDIQEELERKLKRCGIMYRIFARTKSWYSLNKKLLKNSDKYGSGQNQKKVQDIIGLRIVFYFISDIRPFYNLLCGEPNHEKDADSDSETEVKKVLKGVKWPNEKDKISYEEVFRPTRLNIVMRMDGDILENFKRDVEDNWGLVSDKIDATYEVQLRSVLSEGWHEVEHDLRYKFKEDWLDIYERESRMLNSVYASLEANENAMERLFEDKAHRHYVGKAWEPMLRHHLRLRFSADSLSKKIMEIFDADKDSAKPFLKTEREDLMKILYSLPGTIPTSYDNMVYIINRMQREPNEAIKLLEPERIKEVLNNYFDFFKGYP